MPANSTALPKDLRETVPDLRKRLGMFSFAHDEGTYESISSKGANPNVGLRPGVIVEWLTASPGAGAVVSAMQIMSRPSTARGIVAIVDGVGECYAPALSGWGLRPEQTLLVCPASQKEASWAIEQCLRCPGVSTVWAWIDRRFSPHVHRRWQMAAEAGGSVGMLFRPESARREPAWADLRMLVTPLAGGQDETRRVRIEVLYRRGGLGGTARVWEIDHAEGVVRLVPEMADPKADERAARA